MGVAQHGGRRDVEALNAGEREREREREIERESAFVRACVRVGVRERAIARLRERELQSSQLRGRGGQLVAALRAWGMQHAGTSPAMSG